MANYVHKIGRVERQVIFWVQIWTKNLKNYTQRSISHSKVVCLCIYTLNERNQTRRAFELVSVKNRLLRSEIWRKSIFELTNDPKIRFFELKNQEKIDFWGKKSGENRFFNSKMTQTSNFKLKNLAKINFWAQKWPKNRLSNTKWAKNSFPKPIFSISRAKQSHLSRCLIKVWPRSLLNNWRRQIKKFLKIWKIWLASKWKSSLVTDKQKFCLLMANERKFYPGWLRRKRILENMFDN